MKGKINWYDPKKNIGFISPDDGTPDVFFHISNVVGDDMQLLSNEPVEFEAEESSKKPGTFIAKNIRYPAGFERKEFRIEKTGKGFIKPGEYLRRWANIIIDDIDKHGTGREPGVLHSLKSMALKGESWTFGSEASDLVPFPILRSYFLYTFFRLYKEKKICEVNHSGEQYAAFNTGLVNQLYDPIYAFFASNRHGKQPWSFNSFCCANIETSGRKLASLFDPLPEPPKYFNSPQDVIIDPNANLLPRYDHIIKDGIERNRFPKQFLEDNKPRNFEWLDPDLLNYEQKKTYLKDFVKAVDSDPRCHRDIKRRLDDAVELAMKRARWNFKTAIPTYFPTKNKMSLLLPIALVDDEIVDIALVAERTPAGSYSGETVLPLDWAYKHARLVCRPDSDWLSPDLIFGSSDSESPEDSDENDETGDNHELRS